MDDPLRLVRVTVYRQLKEIGALIEALKMARTGPVFQVARVKDG